MWLKIHVMIYPLNKVMCFPSKCLPSTETLISILGSCLQEQGQQDWVEGEVHQQGRVCCPGH